MTCYADDPLVISFDFDTATHPVVGYKKIRIPTRETVCVSEYEADGRSNYYNKKDLSTAVRGKLLTYPLSSRVLSPSGPGIMAYATVPPRLVRHDYNSYYAIEPRDYQRVGWIQIFPRGRVTLQLTREGLVFLCKDVNVGKEVYIRKHGHGKFS
jgi:hypothetical protein